MTSAEFRRRYDRKAYATDIVFSFKGRSHAGTLKDISLGGAFVLTRSVTQVSKGDEVTINIPFTDGRKSVKRRAKILWTNENGFAVEFF